MKTYPLKSLKPRHVLKILTVFVLLSVLGCAGESVRVEFPLNHPANPQAPESQFTPPQNIFKTDLAAEKGGSEADSMMPHKMPPKSNKQQPHLHHQMGSTKKNKSDSDSKQKPAHDQGGNMHQEHSQ